MPRCPLDLEKRQGDQWKCGVGDDGTCVAVDMIFTDGSNLRDAGAVDQSGNPLRPAQQCGHLTMDQWSWSPPISGQPSMAGPSVRLILAMIKVPIPVGIVAMSMTSV